MHNVALADEKRKSGKVKSTRWEMTLLSQSPSDNLKPWLRLPWDGFVVHYHEIGLKGGNRRPFIRRLQQNLTNALRPFKAVVEDLFDRLFVRVPSEVLGEALKAAAQVFGVAYTALVRLLPRSLEAMQEAARETYQALATDRQTVAVRVRRVDKTFPMTSREVEQLVGRQLVATTGASVNLDAPDILLTFRIYADSVYLLGPKVPGVGGLPVGVSGRVLALLSGGIDSPVAAWLMMRRGCLVDFVHFHAFPNAEEALVDKVPKLVETLVVPQGVSARLFLVPYHIFQLALLMSKVPPSLELVLFRRFMVRVAHRLAQEHNYQAIVTGDNLGQVASQTLENLRALDDASALPIFRPLIAWDKQEILAFAQRIGTYALSLQPYKDCCSLIARHPQTKAKLEAVHRAEKQLPLEQLIERTLSEVVVKTIHTEPLEKDATQKSAKEMNTIHSEIGNGGERSG